MMTNRLFNLLTLALIFIVLLLPLTVHAQDGQSPAPAAVAIIPPLLLGLMAANNRATEAFKLYLTSPSLPYTPPEHVRSFLVLCFSVLFGLGSAWLTPNANEWLGAEFAAYPLAAIFVTGISVSLGGAAFQMVLAVLASLRKEPTPSS